FEIFVGRHVETRDRRRHDVLHTRPNADGKAKVINRCLDYLLVYDALQPVQQRLPLAVLKLARLAAEKAVDLRQRSKGKRTFVGDERLKPGGGVAGDAAYGP